MVSCNCPEARVAESLAKLGELPDARRLTSMSAAQIFWMFKQGEDIPSGPGGGFNPADCTVHEAIAIIRTRLLLGPLVRNAPRVCPVPAGLWAVVVGPVGARPSATRGRVDAAVELACLDATHPGVLSRWVHQVVLGATYEDVNFMDDQAEAMGHAKFAQAISDAGFPFNSGEEIGNGESPLTSPGRQNQGAP